MLVLARKKGESIMIGNQIEVVILDTEGDTVRIGINAPRQIEVFRKEVYDAIQQSNREASLNLPAVSDLDRIFGKSKGNK